MKLQVLRVFKALHTARKIVFEGDIRALEAGRIKINEEFKKNKHVSNKDAIDEVRLLCEITCIDVYIQNICSNLKFTYSQ